MRCFWVNLAYLFAKPQTNHTTKKKSWGQKKGKTVLGVMECQTRGVILWIPFMTPLRMSLIIETQVNQFYLTLIRLKHFWTKFFPFETSGNYPDGNCNFVNLMSSIGVGLNSFHFRLIKSVSNKGYIKGSKTGWATLMIIWTFCKTISELFWIHLGLLKILLGNIVKFLLFRTDL